MPSSAAVQTRPVPTSGAMALLEMVGCDRRSMRLTLPGCVRLWEAAQAKRPEKWEGCFACVACPLGAARAGKPLSTAEMAGEKLRGVCVRCRRPSDRLICEGRWCASCYNRGREVRIGANRKGQQPRLRLRDMRMAVQGAAGASIEVRMLRQVADLPEAMLTVAKANPGQRFVFGLPPAVLPDPPEVEEVSAAPLYANTSGVAEGSAPSHFPNEGADGHRLPGSAGAEAPADVGRPVVAPAPLREGGIDVGPAPASGKSPASQVRREAAIGSRRWLLQGATAFIPVARLLPCRFDAMMAFRAATLEELRVG